MKRLLAGVAAFVLVSVLLFGCGGGGGGGSTDSTVPTTIATTVVTTVPPTIPSTTTTTIVTTTVVTTVPPTIPRIKAEGFLPVPESQRTERITIVVNASFAQAFANWQTKAQQKLVDSVINGVLARTAIEKRYAIAKFATYDDALVSEMALASFPNPNSEFYFDNGFTNKSRIAGTTVFVHMSIGTAVVLPQVFMSARAFCIDREVNGKIYKEIWVSGDTDNSVLTTIKPGFSEELAAGAYLHELGHGDGLAGEEWWPYNFWDLTGRKPDLGNYDRRNLFAADVMSGGNPPDKLFIFSDQNSKLISLNANKQYSSKEILFAVPDQIVVRVTNSQGLPLSGETVEVFGAKELWPPFSNSQPLLETLTTGIGGEVVIKNDFSTIWRAKIIKAFGPDGNAGAFLMLPDLQESYLNGQNVYTLTLKLE